MKIDRNMWIIIYQELTEKMKEIQYDSVAFLRTFEPYGCLISKDLEQNFRFRNTYFQVKQGIEENTGILQKDSHSDLEVTSSRLLLMQEQRDYPGYHSSKLAHDVELNPGPKVICF